MITLKNWYQQQPEVVYFVQTDYQGDEFMKKLVRRKMTKEQWDKTMVANCTVGFISRKANRLVMSAEIRIND